MTLNQSFGAKQSAGKAQVLFFNLPEDERFSKIFAFLESRNILARRIASSDQQQTLGFLLGLPGHTSRQTSPFSFRFTDEMLVMCGFSQSDLDAFLRFFKTEGLKRVELKAMLTPTNADWDAVTLHRHLCREREAFSARTKSL